LKTIKNIAIIALFAIIPIASMAQYKFYYPELYIGTNQGIAVWPIMGFKPSVEQNVDVRYHGGFSVKYIIQKYFGIGAELNYTQRGWSEKSKITGERYEHRLDYIELPLISHIFFGTKMFKFNINLGPKIRYMIYDKATQPFSVDPGAQQLLPIEHRFDYSVFAGVAFEFRTKKASAFFVEVRYDYGLGNIFASSKSDPFSQSNNQAFTVSVGYLYNVLYKKNKTDKK